MAIQINDVINTMKMTTREKLLIQFWELLI